MSERCNRITGIKHKWFSPYLDDRNQIVESQSYISNPGNIKIEVLQGSVLGPNLFLFNTSEVIVLGDYKVYH